MYVHVCLDQIVSGENGNRELEFILQILLPDSGNVVTVDLVMAQGS